MPQSTIEYTLYFTRSTQHSGYKVLWSSVNIFVIRRPSGFARSVRRPFFTRHHHGSRTVVLLSCLCRLLHVISITMQLLLRFCLTNKFSRLRAISSLYHSKSGVYGHRPLIKKDHEHEHVAGRFVGRYTRVTVTAALWLVELEGLTLQ